jgi:two-component system phosphate regulon sensor histidine kinase PhoR
MIPSSPDFETDDLDGGPGFEVAADRAVGIDFQSLFTQYAARDDRGLLIIGPRRRVIALNRSARRLLGYEGEIPMPASEVVPDLHLGFAIGEAFHDRVPVTHESFAPQPDRLLRYQILPILAPSGEPVLVLASIEDVTRLRHLETVRRDFVANVSHELRTPLASITLLVETLQRGAKDDAEAALHFLHRIEVETQAMARLVEELLELSRLETGVLSVNLEVVLARRLLDEAVNRLSPYATEKGVEIRFDIQEPLPDVRADPRRIEQVMMNLLHNAIKFTPQGGVVTLRAFRQGRGLQIEVSDTGVGMDPSEAARVFERFYKVDRGRSRAEGAGLGLAIARHLLELHGSQLQVVSGVGRGARFFFALPLADG